MAVTSDLRFNHSDLIDNNHNNKFSMYYTHCFFMYYLVCDVIVCFSIFMLSKHSLDDNMIGNEGGVALEEALKVNQTLQTLI